MKQWRPVLTKLDNYDLIILPGVIRVKVTGTNDPSILDIMSEIHHSEGNISIDGQHYSYLDNYEIFRDNGQAYLELQAVSSALFR